MTQRSPDSAPYLQLLMEAGSQKFSDRMVKLNSPVFVGRQTFEQTKGVDNAFFESGVLSAKHGLLFYDNQRFWFKDTNSRNGSWLNNVKIKAEQTVVLKEGDLLQLGRDSPTDKQILGKIKLFYPHEDSSLIPSSCAVLADTEDIQESSLEKTASFESLIEQLRKIEKRTPYEEDRFQRLQHADDHMKLFGSDIKEAVYFSGLATFPPIDE